jgi:hypothetical protein
MNKLQEKAAELLDLANQQNNPGNVVWINGASVLIEYSGNLYSRITLTETGRARVESWESAGRKTENISLKALPDYLRYHAERLQEQKEKAGN